MTDILGISADLITILLFVWPIIVWVVGVFVYLRFFRRKEKRLFDNMKRPIAIIPAAGNSMAIEIQLIEKNGFFSIDQLSADIRATDLVSGNHRLVVLAYEPNKKFWEKFNALKSKQIPVIVYCKPGQIKANMDKVQSYSLHTVCNTPLRLISDIFAIMSTYPEDRGA